ncbi:PAS domain S-box protein [Sporosarcina sp. P12(2017)]|uniref:sensor domain-containing diguanylate cyclase n=1 Tax=unclassified Sporosarcina TaxID=2647733 RepID=UPI000C165A90|nr:MULTISPECIES: diguanylate cyclase [unclassified Sporosarcina]PIC58322.1 PAS domain S-box protein [Sporosarcina sp. P10]PIC61513.1 PAS domain S-box protein [Sporosarcina sp. P12(2017)]
MDRQLDSAPFGYFTLDDTGMIVEINQTLLSLLGYQLHEVKGKHINLILPNASRSFYQLYFFPMIRLQNKVEEMYFSFKSKDGQEISVLLNALRNERDGKAFNDCACLRMKNRIEYEEVILAAKKDTETRNLLKVKQIQELERLRIEYEAKQNKLLALNETLQEMAITDGLTGLKNRHYLQESLSSYFMPHNERSLSLSFLLIDIDFFKKVNDTYGHLTGDSILRELGRLFREESRTEDVAARYGGEEFALVLPATEKVEALEIAERIRCRVENADWNSYGVTVSIGVATKVPGDTENSLQSRADWALYTSKDNGRNRITFG